MSSNQDVFVCCSIYECARLARENSIIHIPAAEPERDIKQFRDLLLHLQSKDVKLRSRIDSGVPIEVWVKAGDDGILREVQLQMPCVAALQAFNADSIEFHFLPPSRYGTNTASTQTESAGTSSAEIETQTELTNVHFKPPTNQAAATQTELQCLRSDAMHSQLVASNVCVSELLKELKLLEGTVAITSAVSEGHAIEMSRLEQELQLSKEAQATLIAEKQTIANDLDSSVAQRDQSLIELQRIMQIAQGHLADCTMGHTTASLVTPALAIDGSTWQVKHDKGRIKNKHKQK